MATAGSCEKDCENVDCAGSNGSLSSADQVVQSEPTVYAISGLYNQENQAKACGATSNLLCADSPDVSVCQFGCLPHHGHCMHLHYTELGSTDKTMDDSLSLSESKQCGFWSFRPKFLQKFANIQVFVFLSCLLVALQQMLSSGYFNSVITTIEKRYDIPSAVSGTIASTYEIGNLVTIIFVSYLGTHRHIPVWIGKGTLLMGIGAICFALPHFIDQQGIYSRSTSTSGGSGQVVNLTLLLAKWDEDTTCKAAVQGSSIGSYSDVTDECEDERTSSALYVFIFMFAQVLIGCGGSPIFTLGTTYIDDHVKKDSSSMYIGCIYSMVAFGLVCGYLLGGYLLSLHHNILFFETSPMEIYPGHPRWIGAWWGGFLICGMLLLLVAIPFFSFPKSLERDKQKVKEWTEQMEAARLRHKKRKALVKSKSSVGATASTTAEHQAAKDSNTGQHHRRNLSTSSMPALSTPYHARHAPPATSTSGATVTCHRRNASSASWCVMLPHSKHGRNASGNVNKRFPFLPFKKREQSTSSMLCHQDGYINSNSGTCGIAVDEHHHKSESIDYGKNIKDIPKCMMKLLCNPVYVVTCLGSCMELAIVSGFVIFLPKYLETQFSLSNSQANLFTGGIAIPGACVGIFMGGYLLKRYQLGPKGAVQLVLVFITICMTLFTLLFFLGCDNVKMAGATMPYYNTSESFNNGEEFQVNLTADCNMDCRCTQEVIEPVCGRNGLTYFSPCHAGCTAELGQYPHQNFTNCACIRDNVTVLQEVTAVPLARNGPCPNVCEAILPFMILLFIMTLVVSVTQMPLLMIMLRSVDQDERSFALGMQFVIFRVFAYIPAPILFGNVIDSTCILWKAHCGELGGLCLVYNIEQFRMKYVGVASTLKVISGLLFTLDWYLIRKRYKQDDGSMKNTFNMDDMMVSLSSLNLSSDQLNRRPKLDDTHPLSNIDDAISDDNESVNDKP